MDFQNVNVLHLGYNSSVPLIFERIVSKIFVVVGKRKIFKEQEHLTQIRSLTKTSSFFGFIKRIHEIKTWVEEYKIDIIFTNRFDDMLASKLALFFRKKRPLIFGTFHNPLTWENDRKVKLLIPIIKLCLDGHLCMASFAYDKLVRYGYPKDQLLFFQNYIKFETFSQKKSYRLNKEFRICFNGTIDERKNEIFTINVVRILKEKYNLVLDLYGRFLDSNYEIKIRDFLDKNNMNGTVNIHNALPPDEEKKTLLNYDLYMSASLTEMCPLNILNAKACALPLLIADTHGQQDLVSHEIDGLKYNKDDINDAINKMEKLICNEDLRARLGRGAYFSVSCSNSYINASSRLKDFIQYIYGKRNKNSDC